MYTIENDKLLVTVNNRGAELSSLVNKVTKQEYMWSGDPAFWGKKSPVLFPIVGTLKENIFTYKGRRYELSRHGFARDKVFQVTSHTSSVISFNLESSEDTLRNFPFPFSFSVIYTLNNHKLSVTYSIENPAKDPMFFSIGGHPAFRLPIAAGLQYNDYYLSFNQTENAGRWPINGNGLITLNSVPFLENTNKLQLDKELFYNDALVFKHLHSDAVILRSDKNAGGFTFSFSGFPYLGIWAAKNADFVCIEPWCGIADSENSNQNLADKEGIVKLDGAHVFERTWSIDIF